MSLGFTLVCFVLCVFFVWCLFLLLLISCVFVVSKAKLFSETTYESHIRYGHQIGRQTVSQPAKQPSIHRYPNQPPTDDTERYKKQKNWNQNIIVFMRGYNICCIFIFLQNKNENKKYHVGIWVRISLSSFSTSIYKIRAWQSSSVTTTDIPKTQK